MTGRVSIVTLTHNKLEVTRRCLPTLLDAGSDAWDLVVVDNGSTDGTPDWLRAFAASATAEGHRVDIIENDGNIGCSTARNQGIAAADGDYVAFIDNDVAVRSADWLQCLAARLDEDPAHGFVGPKLVYPAPPHAVQCAGVGISRNGRVQFIGRGQAREAAALNVAREVQCLISACFMTRRDVLERIGGFDEAFNPVEFEDFDLVYRAREAGLKALYEPHVEMYHCESVTTAGTASLPNTRLIVEHGLLFKQRWQHLYADEEGPSEEDCRWQRRPGTQIEDIENLPLLTG